MTLPPAARTSRSPTRLSAARRWTSSRTTSARRCSPIRTSTLWRSRWCGTRCGRRTASARRRARLCASWGSQYECGRSPGLGGFRSPVLRGASPPRRRRARGRRGLGARLGPFDLRRAALDRDDHRAARRGAGGNLGVTAALEIASPEREALGHLILSLADNKAALGRRYGEWAVSAPTLESAVAAAAMAQDELGHSRATYPLLKQLGGGGEQVAGGGNCLPLLAREFPGWEWFVAANLAVDGMFTAFVRACEESSFAGLAQRARKILQEERSHEVHARAWARRLARDERRRDSFAATLGDSWWQAARWAGPPEDADFVALVAGGIVAAGPDTLRGSLRTTIGKVLGDTGLPRLALPEPHDWAGWTPEERV